MTLTKEGVAKKIADDCGFMKGEAYEIVEKILELIKNRLIAGEDVMISSFGKWSVRSKHARRGRNLQTGVQEHWHYSQPMLGVERRADPERGT